MFGSQPQTVLLFGATGTIGRATAHALLEAGHRIRCVVRPSTQATGLPDDAELLPRDLGDVSAGDFEGIDSVVSCLASRSGAPDDAWAVDHDAHVQILNVAQSAGVGHFVLLSAICVQKPKLAFQKAKLAFEQALQSSGVTYSIVRPTAFFKSLSGQVARVQAGKGFLMFGDGELTACKPISDRDLGRYLALCLTDPSLQNRVLPIGGPGGAITPRAQGALIFAATGEPESYRKVPVWVMDGIIRVLTALGHLSAGMKAKAELAKIGRYYATESMLVWDGQRYDEKATPSFGSDTLRDHYDAMVKGKVAADLGDHSVF